MAWPPEARPMTRGRILRTFLADPRSRAWLLFLRFGLGYGVFAVLVLVGTWSGAALVMATIAGVAFNFQTSRRLVFRSSGRTLRFIAVYVVVLILNWAALRTLRRYGLSDLESQALLTLPIAAMSFLGQRTFVFSPTNGPA